jgi:predicted TIM-barrel fold metal-dependent hydrolase
MADAPERIDAYAHVGLPRFQSVADYDASMMREGIGGAVLCAFDSSPDLEGIHAAFTQRPDRFRGLGVPLGRDRAEMEKAAEAQLAAGFSGLRLSDADVTERGFLLDILARRGRIAIVCGRSSGRETAQALLAYLERHPQAIVIGGHFAGAGDPRLIESGVVAELFAHPRFYVVFSRHGGYPEATIRPWAQALIERVGWSRLMWGSEAPVLYWRNETVESAIAWVDALRPTPDQRARFFSGNAAALYFARPVESAPLSMPFEPRERVRVIPATMWANALPIDQALAGRLVAAWLAAGGEGTLGQYLERVLDQALPKI